MLDVFYVSSNIGVSLFEGQVSIIMRENVLKSYSNGSMRHMVHSKELSSSHGL